MATPPAELREPEPQIALTLPPGTAGRLAFPLRGVRPARYLPWAMLALLAAAAADMLQPAGPVLARLASGAAMLGGFALLLRFAWPRAGWSAGLLAATLPAAILLPLLSLAQRDLPRGLLATRAPYVAAVQQAVFPLPPDPALPAEALAALLGEPRPRLRAEPATADEALFNALVLHRRDAPLPAAQALALALRLAPDTPRPDALVLQDALWASGVPTAQAALATLPEALQPAARAQIEAVRLPDPAARAASLSALLAEYPEARAAMPPLARALLRAAMPEGPTIAQATRLVALGEAFRAPEGFPGFAAGFLDPSLPARLAEEMAELESLRELAGRRLSVAVLAPPPGVPDLPLLLRITPPEPWNAVEMQRGTEPWSAVPQRTEAEEAGRDPAPTLRLPPPWRATEFRFRYLDRHGEASTPLPFRLDPVPAIREAAQRALARQGAFALYVPGRVMGNRLNPFPIAAHFRPGLAAIEWFTEADRKPKRVELAVTDAAVLAGTVPRWLVEIEVGPTAQSLFMTAIYADGSRSPVEDLPIR